MELLLIVPVLLFSIVVHEFAHGWVALRRGDPTAYMLGRLTLNPIPHIDLFGSLIFPALLWVANLPVFGWAKPVPVNPRNFREYKKSDILVSIAGITANLLLALIFTLAIVLLVHLVRLVPALGPSAGLLRQMAQWGIFINLILAFFNLIPIPPLDGSHVLYHLLPPGMGARYRAAGRYGMLILLGVLMFLPGVLRLFLLPVTILNSAAQAFIQLWT